MRPQQPSLRAQLARLRSRGLWPYLLVALGCALVLTLLAFGRLHSEFGIDAMHRAQTYKAQIDRFDHLLTLLLDAETGVRGFLLNERNPIYLEPYAESEKAMDTLLMRIGEDYPPGSDDHDEYAMLTRLIATKRQLLADTIRAGQVISAGPVGQAGSGKRYMDQIRLSIATLRARIEARNLRLVNESVTRFGDIRHTITVLALGALGLLVALFAVQQRQAMLRARIAELLEHENVALEYTVAERTRELSNLASYLTETRETEKARLAREMHDELGALLTAAKMDASWLLRSLGDNAGPDIQARFRRLIDTLGSGITIKRRIIDDLRPPLLQGLGLVEALRALSDDLRGEYEMITRLPDTDVLCPEEQALALFRIAQEAITNVRKYAGAHHLEIGLEVTGPDIHLWIADDGKGFDPASPRLNRHGLAGMKHRVQMFEGEFAVTSAPGEGTRIDARMPLRDALLADSVDDQAVA